jgi:transcription-repair coupling factor (superfamily II helicase)
LASIHRLPIVTKVAPLSDGAIAAALLREQRRRGRSFFNCPRIRRARLHSGVPDLSVVCLHGRLPVDEIDDRMMSFVEGKPGCVTVLL